MVLLKKAVVSTETTVTDEKFDMEEQIYCNNITNLFVRVFKVKGTIHN